MRGASSQRRLCDCARGDISILGTGFQIVARARSPFGRGKAGAYLSHSRRPLRGLGSRRDLKSRLHFGTGINENCLFSPAIPFALRFPHFFAFLAGYGQAVKNKV